MADTTLTYEQYFFTPDKNYLQTPAIYINWAGYRVCDSTHVIGPRVLDTYKMVFILSGHGYLIQDNNEKILLKVNDMFILFPKHRHHYWAAPDDPWTITWVTFNGADSPNLINSIHVSLDTYVLRGVLTDSIRTCMAKIVQALADETDPYRLEAVSTMFSVFNKLRKNQKNLALPHRETEEEPLVSRITAFIEQNYYMEIDMAMICSHIHYSRSYLSRKFKSEKGCSIQQFLIDTRINRARSLLLETALSVQEVAASVGINDSLYFSRTFHRKTGYSPSEYRSHFSDRP